MHRENTLPAFATCLELGIGFELDIRTTQDGKLVVLHDATLVRTTNGPNRPLSEFTWKQLQKFDAGSWFDPRFTGVRVPSLEETFALVKECKRRPSLLALNVKGITREGEKELVRLLGKFKLFKESFAFDQSDECSERLKALDPRIRIGRNVRREEIDSRLAEGATDIYLLTSVPNEAEVSLLRKHRKAISSITPVQGSIAERRKTGSASVNSASTACSPTTRSIARKYGDSIRLRQTIRKQNLERTLIHLVDHPIWGIAGSPTRQCR